MFWKQGRRTKFSMLTFIVSAFFYSGATPFSDAPDKKKGDLSGLIYLPINVNISLFFFLLEDGSYICMGVWGREEILKFLWHFLYRFSINSSSFQPVYYVLLIPHPDTHNCVPLNPEPWRLSLRKTGSLLTNIPLCECLGYVFLHSA